MEFDKLAEANRLEAMMRDIKRELAMWKALNSKEDFGIRVRRDIEDSINPRDRFVQYVPIPTLLPYEFFDRFKADAIAALAQMLEETEAEFKAL